MKDKLISQTIKAGSKTGFFSAYGSIRSRLYKQHIPIIVYHRVSKVDDYPWSLTPVSPQDFEKEIRYLIHRYRIISLDELADSFSNLKKLPPKTAVITFDDGYKDVFLNAYPILKKFKVPATVFLTTGHIGTRELFWWDKVGYVIWKTKNSTFDLGELGTYYLNSDNDRIQTTNVINEILKIKPHEHKNELIKMIIRHSGVDIPPKLGEELIMSWDDIKEMRGNGVNFGAHTVSHPILTRLPLEAARKEILDSKKHIEKELGQEITTFCYPNGEPGDYSGDIENILQSNGFKCAITLTPTAFVSPKSRIYELPRIPGTTSFDTFKLVTSGLYTDLFNFWSLVRR
jgi:peptidoglycan/xylan/chitin deacetylase (PgdA/CDA1 family)